jgi:anaerobic ribonucleoside-triphosphate reductase activating protein
MRYAQIRHYDIANGTGIRTSIFFTGCTHNCYNCFNKQYQDFSYGKELTQKEITLIAQYLREKEISGISLLGGEPLQQNFNDMRLFLEQIYSVIHKHNKTIWMYSGYTYEEILQDKHKFQIVQLCDVLVDGRYIERLRDLRLKFRGSSNQRIIDVQQSLKQNKVVLYDM